MEACGVLIVFGKNIARANMQLRERRVFWLVAAKLGLQSAEAGLYMTCLASLNQMVSWFLLNDAFCKLLSVHQMNMGR